MTASFCVDCRWHVPETERYNATCVSPRRPKAAATVDLVTGEDVPEQDVMLYCSVARSWRHLCGPSGRWFEPADGV